MSRFARWVLGVVVMAGLTVGPTSVHAQPADAEESPLLRDPDTPKGAYAATLQMVDIARPRLARRYLDLLLGMAPDDDTLLDIREEFGAESFLKLSSVKALQPQSIQLLDRVNAAFRARAQDPARVDQLIGLLRGTAEERANAVLSLREGGANVVPRMLESVNSPAFAGEPDAIVLALTKIGSEVVAPLSAAVADGTEEQQRRVAIDALGYAGSKEDVVELWYPAFATGQPAGIQQSARAAIGRLLRAPESRVNAVTTDGVVRELKRIAREHLDADPTADGNVDMWTWVAADARVGRVTLPAELVSLYHAARFSRQAVGLAPEDAEAQAMHVAAVTGLALAKNGWTNGLPTGGGTAHDLAIAAGPGVANEALAEALERENALASLAMLTVLGRIGRESDLYAAEGAASPLVAALDDSDQRVRFAAANAILLIDPKRPFPRAARVVEVLRRALADDGGGRVAVVDGNIARGRTMATLFAQLGLIADSAKTGQDGFRLASNRGDIELVALQANVARWGLSQTIANLRADARTKALPIVVYGDPDFPTRNVEGLKRRYEPIHFVEFSSIREETLLADVRPFVQAARPDLTPEQRVEMQEAALYWVAEIARGRRTGVFDISSTETELFALATDDVLADDALTALAAIPKASAQQRLQELTVNETNGVAVRRPAALRLAEHVRRHGLLLTDEQTIQIRRAWEGSDPAMASALATVVGTLKPNARRVSDRILASPPVSLVPGE